MADVIDTCPMVENGSIVHVASDPLSIKTSGFWLAALLVLVLLAALVAGDR